MAEAFPAGPWNATRYVRAPKENDSMTTLTDCLRRTGRPAAVLAALFLGTADSGAAEWKWSLTPYAWASNVGANVTLDGRQVLDKEIAFTDLLGDLDTVAQVRLEGQRGAHGLMVDLFNVELSKDDTRPAPPAGAPPAVVDSRVGMTIVEIGGIYDPRGDQQGLSFLYGARILSERAGIDATVEAEPATTVSHDVSETLVDALVGVRYTRTLSRRWSTQLRLDVSAGGTDLTWSGASEIRYAFGASGRYTLSAGYRHMKVDFDTADATDVAMTLSGFHTGLRISF
jgi:hypothetical protein